MSWHADVSDWVEKPSVIQIFGDDGSECDYLPEQADRLAVLNAIDGLRRELTGYHGQLKAWNDLKVHSDRQRVRIGELEGLYAKAKAENAKLRELVCELWHHARLLDANEHIDGLRITSERAEEYRRRLAELGIEVES